MVGKTHFLFIFGLLPFAFSLQSAPCGNNSKIADRVSCNRYLECFDGHWKVKSCPPQLQFDPEKGICTTESHCRQKRVTDCGAYCPPKKSGYGRPQTKPESAYSPQYKPKPVEEEEPDPEPDQPSALQEFLPKDCGLSGNELKKFLFGTRVVGGKVAPIEAYPWQVAIVTTNSKSLRCGGSIISKKHVLTAAHCFVLKKGDANKQGNPRDVDKILNKSKRVILAGITNLGDPKEEFDITDVFVHSKYKSEHSRNDIALIVIDGEFEWSSTVFPVCLPSSDAEYDADRSCRISGWGQTTEDAKSGSEVLRAAKVKIVDQDDCERENGKKTAISKGMFCAGDYSKGSVDTCQGDSGGPCTCDEKGKATLFGITSWGIGCGRAQYPGVYARVSAYLPWIEKVLQVAEGMKNREWLKKEEDEDIGGSDEDEDEDEDDS